MTANEVGHMALEVITDCPLNEFFVWEKEAGKRICLTTQIFSKPELQATAFIALRRNLEKSLFNILRAELLKFARPEDRHRIAGINEKLIAGREYFGADILDPEPLRGSPEKIIPAMIDNRVNPEWLNADQEIALRATTFVTDNIDTMQGAKIKADTDEKHGVKAIHLYVTIGAHRPGAVHYTIFQRRRQR
jgi:hypothetical protein